MSITAKAIDKAMQEKPDLFIAVEDSSQIIAMEFNADSSHDIWDESDSIDTETMDKITERYINEASKGDMEGYVKAPYRYIQKTAPFLTLVFLS